MGKSTHCRMAAKLLVLLTFVLPVLFGAELELVNEGKTLYVITYADSPSQNLFLQYRNAADLLKELIAKRTGVTLKVVPEKSLEADVHAIHVGPTAAAKSRGLVKSEWLLNEYRMKADKGDVFLLGDDNDPVPTQKQGFHRLRLGSVKAILEFAKKFVGADFLYPDKEGIYVPHSTSLAVPEELDVTAVPYTRFAIGRSTEPYYAMANDMLPAPWYRCHGGHSHIPAIPPAKYLQEHLEYFAVVNGKRNGYASIPQYCLSNPEVQKLIYQELLDSLNLPGVQETQLAQTDGFRVCECDACKEFFKEGAGEALWKLHLRMAERLLKERPGKFVRIIAYGPTVEPPSFTKVFPQNVSVTLAAGQKMSESYLKRWQECKVPGGFDVYLYNWGEYHTEGLTPSFSIKKAQEQTALFRKYGINAIYFCGLTELPGMNSPVVTYYLRAFAGDTNSPEAFLKSFCEKSFGSEAASYMEQFYTLLYSRIDLSDAAKEDYTMPGAQKQSKSVFAPNVALLHQRYPDEMLAKLDTLLKNGEEKATSGRKLLERARLEMDYLKLTAGGCNDFYAYHATPTQEVFERLAKRIIDRKQFIKALPTYPVGGKQYMKGNLYLPTLGHFPVEMVMDNGRLGAPLKAPFNWDVEYYLEKHIRPSGRILKAGDSEWQQMIDVFGNGQNAYVKEHPVFVRCRVEGENLIAEMRYDNLETDVKRGTIWVRLQKDAQSPRYRVWCNAFGGDIAIAVRTKVQEGNDYDDKYENNPELLKKFPVKTQFIANEGESPFTRITIPLELFGGPATPGEKRFIDFNFHFKKEVYTWEYNLNLLNWRHRYTSIGTLEF
ncbi:MAG: DUF4838 domain-containing protein [Victivallales bacterium]|nr:DUF4838 domain-containing protein [Victivallales bacterium]